MTILSHWYSRTSGYFYFPMYIFLNVFTAHSIISVVIKQLSYLHFRGEKKKKWSTDSEGSFK